MSGSTIFGYLIILIIAGLVYFLPSIIGRKKRNSGTIFLCNLFFGGTGVGWIVCLIWALSDD
ncbi:MAG: superinfection immunity protein [Bacteroidota bacterium]|nr:superinfection immunity protein [Bacteroidota bacterium]